jgi:hypothetical protein
VCSPGARRRSRSGPSDLRTSTVTCCLVLRLHEGMIIPADIRTNAGVDDVGTYRKRHVLWPADDRLFVIESAGSLATTPEVLDRMARDLAAGRATESLATVAHLFEAALYLGRRSRAVAKGYRHALGEVGPTARPPSSSAATSVTRPPTFCSCIPRATTSGPRTTAHYCRSGRAGDRVPPGRAGSGPSRRCSTRRQQRARPAHDDVSLRTPGPEPLGLGPAPRGIRGGQGVDIQRSQLNTCTSKDL